MIKINKYIEERYECFDNNDNSLGFLNQCEFIDLRCQIAENRIIGYYFLDNEKDKHYIAIDGSLESAPDDMFHTNIKLIIKLHNINKQWK